jgi:transposase
MEMLAIDVGKQSFHLYGIDADGVVLSRKVARAKLLAMVTELRPKIVAMEACATAHHWGRTFVLEGIDVRLINPRFVTPFVRGSKNDAVDAEAIFDAACRPTMRFVPVKTREQQDLQSLHRVRDRLMAQRTGLINHTRGLLAEYGVVYPTGAALFVQRARRGLDDDALSPMARETFDALLDELEALQVRLKRIDARLVEISKEHAACRRMVKVPGIGPVVATALIASVGDARQFRSGREMAAWIGLVPRQYTTGGRPRLGGIGQRANHYLRRLLIHGARAVAQRVAPKTDTRSLWLQQVLERRGFNKGVVAMANKTARIAWAVLAREEGYRAA